ncbi:hypothetical protein OSB04_004447 [Centaurea solstitialis]|uniref:START domain-containing protein n=1 Tax=Centaurea solstitialis TaxID=347529 RepID=A0AA38U783_9ASTR|nr:hypothetical protein OSB04_004447 [Centaurea solstitialis]
MEKMWWNSNNLLLLSQGTTSSSMEMEIDTSGGWITYTLAVLTLLFICQFTRFQILPRLSSLLLPSSLPSNNPTISVLPSSSQQQHRISDVITDLDLKVLMESLDEAVHGNDKWENVVDRRNNSISYYVKCCKPKDGGPLKYLSTTTFNLCSSETLRDFYMDNFYRKEWDKTLIDHEQLQVDESNGTEIGRTIKKFPLLTPREYILAWRLWEGRDRTFYCYSKECDHPLAPRQKKYVRVGLLRSGWRIREGKTVGAYMCILIHHAELLVYCVEVSGRNSCEIKMVHQEDAGLNVEMAKVIFAKGIWSYVCKMDNALRKYSAMRRIQLTSGVNAVTLVQKVPPALDCCSSSSSRIGGGMGDDGEELIEKKIMRGRKPSKKMIANGLILVGGVICLARGHPNFSAKVAMAFVLSKLTKRRKIKDR